MALTIVATAGADDANSFVTLDEADAYMESRLNGSTWTGATTDTRNRALAEATRELSPLGWSGHRVSASQALGWPRQWARDPDSPTQDYYDTGVIPQRVKDACCELAFQFLKAGTTDVAAREKTLDIARSKVDVLETEYVAPHARARGLGRYPRVVTLIAPLLGASAGQPRLVRG
jgi:hypothetical protein